MKLKNIVLSDIEEVANELTVSKFKSNHSNLEARNRPLVVLETDSNKIRYLISIESNVIKIFKQEIIDEEGILLTNMLDFGI